MDFIKDAVNNVKGQKAEGQKEEKKGETQDYLDKGVAFASSKAGFNISPDNQEKATDFARGAYEKQTGKKVDPKISQ
ncbi:hypothetical protein BHE90_008654 [Fusarium euwallaceae]|uniref:Uncharacterized protein n=5 Tax=Fusarium solani species complex TaxID=232080 RepID=A0A3M2SMW4_9HYPO|nr:hypothetical protein CDV36_001442 [Fusarium kuroshium]RSL72476.1 hypothetical protein CEP53_001081 [Fusarium sp. AF-6]RSL75603.1 hypothetical protein CEP51_010717 [Fusarium floridanum]RSM12307.1 hypothetical protein CEP52_002510 [Fusarium oligoseptatum]RSM17244.1 hypothetical protein CDV31_003959 [Fusarium ambrosium]RTE76905.1 hypothetical protein BHE90_008654 [Fusarium euwallaceae]